MNEGHEGLKNHNDAHETTIIKKLQLWEGEIPRHPLHGPPHMPCGISMHPEQPDAIIMALNGPFFGRIS
jgi:hypothetical protein